MRIITFLCAFLYWLVASSQDETSRHPLYLGADAGYGSTTWAVLVPSLENQNPGMNLSMPTLVREGGAAWGFFAGYEFGSHFALEANYTRYPNAMVHFDETSMFSFEKNGIQDLYTDTDAISLMAKILLYIPQTNLRCYSSFGAAQVHRWDDLNDTRHVSPAFGLGFMFDISNHVMAELGLNFVAGYGESELYPTKDYVPFLYAGVLKLAYRI